MLLTGSDMKFKHKVSSTLNGSTEYSSKYMFDESLDTCWNSDQGSPQFIVFDFARAVHLRSLSITFQGGFVGQEGCIEVGDSLSQMVLLKRLENIEDTNETQFFDICGNSDNSDVSSSSVTSDNNISGRYVKLSFHSSTDFYGRVTIYSLKFYGQDS